MTKPRFLSALGAVLLLSWCAWWLLSARENRLLGAELLWIRLPSFGSDFWTQTDLAARLWKSGIDPYENKVHLFHYPPLVIRLFLWTPLFEPVTALRIWLGVLVSIVGVGVWRACKTRPELDLAEPPFLLALSATLFTFPVLFALERANFDLITLAALLLALAVLGARFRHRDLLAGAILAVGPWVKIYPGLMGAGLAALRRWKVLAGFCVAGLAIGFAAPAETLRSFENVRLIIASTVAYGNATYTTFFHWSHSLTETFSKLLIMLSEQTASDVYKSIPGWVPALVVLAPPFVWVAAKVYRSPARDRLTYPMLLWTVALASFLPVLANDYSLVFLPLAALAVYSGRDPLLVHGAMALFALWLQPFWLPIGGGLLLVCKLAGLFGVGLSIACRAAE